MVGGVYVLYFGHHFTCVCGRVLGFRRTMPVVGRTINITADIYELTTKSLKDTFFVSPQPDNNRCFFGHCDSYCDIFHPVCGDKDLLEVRRVITYIICLRFASFDNDSAH